jgi:hypothetical protein
VGGIAYGYLLLGLSGTLLSGGACGAVLAEGSAGAAFISSSFGTDFVGSTLRGVVGERSSGTDFVEGPLGAVVVAEASGTLFVDASDDAFTEGSLDAVLCEGVLARGLADGSEATALDAGFAGAAG